MGTRGNRGLRIAREILVDIPSAECVVVLRGVCELYGFRLDGERCGVALSVGTSVEVVRDRVHYRRPFGVQFDGIVGIAGDKGYPVSGELSVPVPSAECVVVLRGIREDYRCGGVRVRGRVGLGVRTAVEVVCDDVLGHLPLRVQRDVAGGVVRNRRDRYALQILVVVPPGERGVRPGGWIQINCCRLVIIRVRVGLRIRAPVGVVRYVVRDQSPLRIQRDLSTVRDVREFEITSSEICLSVASGSRIPGDELVSGVRRVGVASTDGVILVPADGIIHRLTALGPVAVVYNAHKHVVPQDVQVDVLTVLPLAFRCQVVVRGIRIDERSVHLADADGIAVGRIEHAVGELVLHFGYLEHHTRVIEMHSERICLLAVRPSGVVQGDRVCLRRDLGVYESVGGYGPIDEVHGL